MNKPDHHDPTVRMLGAPEVIPVFNCQVIVTPGAGTTPWRGRSANYSGIEASGDSERAVLQQIVKVFKTLAKAKLAAGEKLEAIDPPAKPNEGEQLRWIAVHL